MQKKLDKLRELGSFIKVRRSNVQADTNIQAISTAGKTNEFTVCEFMKKIGTGSILPR
jgi:hypothetical protein